LLQCLALAQAPGRQVAQHALKGPGLVQVIQVQTLQILQDLLKQHFLRVAGTNRNARDAVQADDDGRIAASVTVNNAICIPLRHYAQRLQDAMFANGLS